VFYLSLIRVLSICTCQDRSWSTLQTALALSVINRYVSHSPVHTSTSMSSVPLCASLWVYYPKNLPPTRRGRRVQENSASFVIRPLKSPRDFLGDLEISDRIRIAPSSSYPSPFQSLRPHRSPSPLNHNGDSAFRDADGDGSETLNGAAQMRSETTVSGKVDRRSAERNTIFLNPPAWRLGR